MDEKREHAIMNWKNSEVTGDDKYPSKKLFEANPYFLATGVTDMV